MRKEKAWTGPPLLSNCCKSQLRQIREFHFKLNLTVFDILIMDRTEFFNISEFGTFVVKEQQKRVGKVFRKQLKNLCPGEIKQDSG